MEQDRYAKHCDTLLREFPEKVCLSLDALTDRIGLSRSIVSTAVGRLVTLGLVERRKVGCYQLTTNGVRAKRGGVSFLAPAKPKPFPAATNDFHQRVWSVMRMSGSGTFTTREVVMVINWPIQHPEVAARRYLRQLKGAGYVIELPKREQSNQAGSHGLKRYRLIRNTGQIAPEYKPSRGVLYDPNTKEDVPCAKQA